MNKSFINLNKFWKNKRVFVTGHTGFKGAWLSIFLDLFNAKIFGYSLKASPESLFNQAHCSKIYKKNFYSNINNLNILKKKIFQTKPEIIFHLAAQSLVRDSFIEPIKTFNTNTMGTLNLLEAARRVNSVKAIVIITTDKVYKIKDFNKKYVEIDELGGKDPYSASKTCAEILVNSYIESFFKEKYLNYRVSTARSGNVIGGGDYSKNRLIPDILSAINKNKQLIIRNPSHIRPWQHVIEPIHGYLMLAKKLYENKLKRVNHSWNFGPKDTSFVKVAQIVNKINKIRKIRKIRLVKSKFIESKVLKLNSKKSIKYLEWKQKWNIDQSIKKIIEWNDFCLKNKKLKKICQQQILDYLKH
jgi:CDP-glucose 4,6-dehydratase